MINDLHSPDGHADGNRESNHRDSNATPLTDREVPLNPRRTPAVVQAWLDGEVTMADAARGEGANDVDFWNRLNEQAEERRHMRTPVHVQQRILEAIPRSAPRAESGWFQRQVHISNGMLVVIGAVMVGLGAAAAILLAR
jgi:hypothetical protein